MFMFCREQRMQIMQEPSEAERTRVPFARGSESSFTGEAVRASPENAENAENRRASLPKALEPSASLCERYLELLCESDGLHGAHGGLAADRTYQHVDSSVLLNFLRVHDAYRIQQAIQVLCPFSSLYSHISHISHIVLPSE